MAIVGLVIGSVLGFFGGAVGWLMWDLTALSALSLYLFTSLTMAAMLVVIGATRQTASAQSQRAEAF